MGGLSLLNLRRDTGFIIPQGASRSSKSNMGVRNRDHEEKKIRKGNGSLYNTKHGSYV